MTITVFVLSKFNYSILYKEFFDDDYFKLPDIKVFYRVFRPIRKIYTHQKIKNNIFIKFHHSLLRMPKIMEIGSGLKRQMLMRNINSLK